MILNVAKMIQGFTKRTLYINMQVKYLTNEIKTNELMLNKYIFTHISV